MIEKPFLGENVDNIQPSLERGSVPPIPEYNPVGERRAGLVKALGLSAVVALTPYESLAQEERVTSPEELAVAESILGAELLERLQQEGFLISVPLEADESGSYVIHIGQYHTNPISGMARHFTAHTVEEFQAKLYEVLPEVAEKGGGVVFKEGFAGTVTDIENAREAVVNTKAAIEEALVADITSLTEVEKVSEYIEWYGRYREHDFVANYITAADMYQLVEKYSNFLKTYEPQDEVEEITVEILRTGLVLNSLGNMMTSVQGDVEMQNATARLYLEDSLTLAPAELAEANNAAMDALQEMEELRPAYRDKQREIVFENPELREVMGPQPPL